jgi:phosphoglycolate phosphatase
MAAPSEDYDFWLFDFDGTLIDIEEGYMMEVMEEVGARLGHGFTLREAETLWHGLGGERNAQLVEWGLDPERFWETFHEVEDPVARAEHTYLYDDAAWVGGLDRPVGLVTHSQQHLTDEALARLGIGDWFDSVVCCSSELGWKPDPAPVRLAMRGLGVDDGGEGVLVGDGPQDIGAAWNAGLEGVHVERHGHERRGLCVLGDRRVGRLDELLEGRAAD